ncbi:MAG: amidophosphoribosyltransferase [Fusobacterium sp. JB021]|nr:amidophosphoribosyltransferase [Fusobacterium sp. JB020]MDP0492917.1 amidophosphoribosyltransferase [Fusobacterium sp. JB021]MDP0505607.1 amidophosphoribosyltransferase [Fusobacterium sp. JB019]
MHEDRLKEECGVFGIFNNDSTDSGRIAYYGLFSLQHRGQESCGIAVMDNQLVKQYKDMGLVPDVFNDEILDKLTGKIAIGHVRYSTAGGSIRQNAQPLVSKYLKGALGISHNGNLTNAYKLRAKFESEGFIFQTSIDSEVIANIIARQRVINPSIENAVSKMMEVVEGSYSLVVMSPKKLIGCRDPHGFRPLVLGKLNNSYVLSSETCSLDAVGAKFIRDIEPGEIVVIDENGITSIKTHCNKFKSSICIFEYIYFARPDTYINGISVYEARKNIGRELAKEHPIEGDIVIGVPDSGIAAAIGYAEESNIPYGIGLVKNKYVGRTFISPTQTKRENGVKVKLNVLKESVKDKKVIIVDDSIVRGTTIKRLVKLLREAGAKEIHMRISSPPFLWPCYYGTDIPSKKDLIACKHSVDEIAKISNLDSLGYLSLNKLNIITNSNCNFCDACFSGNYPAEIPDYLPEEAENNEVEIHKSFKFTLC